MSNIMTPVSKTSQTSGQAELARKVCSLVKSNAVSVLAAIGVYQSTGKDTIAIKPGILKVTVGRTNSGKELVRVETTIDGKPTIADLDLNVVKSLFPGIAQFGNRNPEVEGPIEHFQIEGRIEGRIE